MPRYLLLFIGVLVFVLMPGISPVLAAESESPAAERADMFRGLQERLESLEDELGLYKQEAEARKALLPTREELDERKKTEDVLKATEEEAAEYVLLKSHTIEMRYSLSYSHSSYDRVSTSTSGDLNTQYVDIERESYFNLVNSLGIGYGFSSRISLSASIPLVYKYQQTGDDKEETDLGDIGFGLSYQVMQEVGRIPAILVSLGYTAPTGRSPYKIDPENELSTGSGGHSFSMSCNLSKLLDPVIVFGSFGGSYGARVTGIDQKRYATGEPTMVLEEVRPGWGLSYAFGLGFSLSYTTSITFRFSASHTSSPEYRMRQLYDTRGRVYEGDDSSSASFALGTSWRLSPKTSLSVSLGYGLVGMESYSISVSFPFEFTL